MTGETKRNQTQSSEAAPTQNQGAKHKQIVFIGAVSTDVVIVAVGAMAGDGRQRAEEQK